MPSPWALGGLTLVELTRRVWSSIKEDAVMERAASLSYYFLFALFPTLLFLTALWGASNGMASIVIALNVAYDIDDVRPWWLRRLIALTLTMAFSVFTLV